LLPGCDLSGALSDLGEISQNNSWRRSRIPSLKSTAQTEEQWFSILEFSTIISNLPIPEIREAALRAISSFSLDPVEKIVFARQYGVQDWLIEGYVSLVRSRSLPEDVQDRLGTETTCQLLRMRDRSNWECTCTGKLSARTGKMSVTSKRIAVNRGPLEYCADLRADVRSRFAKEIENVEDVAKLNIVSSEPPNTDQLTHHSERGVTRDEVFYFETETIPVSDVRDLFQGIIS
jgi:hypothetical protein